jgi:hypothetical protein
MIGIIYICQHCGQHFTLWQSIDSHSCRGLYLKHSTLVYELTPCEEQGRPYYGIFINLTAYHHIE